MLNCPKEPHSPKGHNRKEQICAHHTLNLRRCCCPCSSVCRDAARGTLFTSSTESITIRSNEPQAKISVNGNEVGKGQAVAVVPNGKQTIITASAPGCSDRSTTTGTAFNAVSVLNTLFIFPWLIDVATGAIHITEPTNYTVTPDCSARGK